MATENEVQNEAPTRNITLAFKPQHPDVQSPEFEKMLAMRLLDILYGRDAAGSPDPVPLLSRSASNTRMIGYSNNHVLINEGEGRYRISSRYTDEKLPDLLNAAETILRQEFDYCLLPQDEQPAKAASWQPPKNPCEFAFDPQHSAVHTPEFGEKLALRLLDILMGRGMACFPDPAPLHGPNSKERLIGHSHNYWLLDEGNGRYRVITRCSGESTKRLLAAAETIIRHDYADCLMPKRGPAVRPENAFASADNV